MRLLINTAILRFGGAVQGALSVIRELRKFPEHEYHVVVGSGVGDSLDTSAYPDNFCFYPASFGVMGLRKVPRVQRTLSDLESRIRPDCVLTTSGPSYWRSRAPHLVGYNLPLYIYPESPYVQKLPLRARSRSLARRWLQRRFFLRDADALIVQTDDVNRRVRAFLGTDNVHTVTNNRGPWFHSPKSFPLRLPQARETVTRFLTMTSYYPHKNLDLIPDVIGALPETVRDRVEFVLTLTSAQYRRHIGPDIPEQVRLIGPVPPPEAPSLFSEIDALFHPTLAECFSAAYPEAMAMSKPIITTDMGFARSICGDSALYFVPTDAASAAHRIRFLIDNPPVQRQLVANGVKQLKTFDSPRERAEKILRICERLSEP